MPQGMSRERESAAEDVRRPGRDHRVDGRDERGGRGRRARIAGGARRLLGSPTSSRNPANPEIHRRTTAEEIWRADTDGEVDVFVAGVGTGGTITGCGERAQGAQPEPARRRRRAEVVAGHLRRAARPAPASRASAPASCPRSSTATIVDEIISVPDDDALETAQRSRDVEGVLAGISAGAAVWAAIEVGGRPEFAGKRIVTILPDSGERYVTHALLRPVTHALDLTGVACPLNWVKTKLALERMRPGDVADRVAAGPGRADRERARARRARTGTR